GESELDHRQVRQVGLDAVLADLALEQLPLTRERDDRLGDGTPALGGRVEAVPAFARPAVAASTQRVGEACARSVQVEDGGRVAALVPERVHDVGREASERPGRWWHLLPPVGPQPELGPAGGNEE